MKNNFRVHYNHILLSNLKNVQIFFYKVPIVAKTYVHYKISLKS